MAFSLDKVVPWGRSYAEYLAMFNLSEADLQQRILGCGDGPAAFNAELTRRGGTIVSFDPIYIFDSIQLKSRIAETYALVMTQLRNNQADFVWQSISSVDELGQLRLAAMDEFLSDYVAGNNAGRYIAGELPHLPFANQQFDLALSSHFLFLYSQQLSLDFHQQAVQEMLRVAREVRIFPILTLTNQISPHLNAVCNRLKQQGYLTVLKQVVYEFQRGANQMLVITRR